MSIFTRLTEWANSGDLTGDAGGDVTEAEINSGWVRGQQPWPGVMNFEQNRADVQINNLTTRVEQSLTLSPVATKEDLCCGYFDKSSGADWSLVDNDDDNTNRAYIDSLGSMDACVAWDHETNEPSVLALPGTLTGLGVYAGLYKYRSLDYSGLEAEELEFSEAPGPHGISVVCNGDDVFVLHDDTPGTANEVTKYSANPWTGIALANIGSIDDTFNSRPIALKNGKILLSARGNTDSNACVKLINNGLTSTSTGGGNTPSTDCVKKTNIVTDGTTVFWASQDSDTDNWYLCACDADDPDACTAMPNAEAIYHTFTDVEVGNLLCVGGVVYMSFYGTPPVSSAAHRILAYDIEHDTLFTAVIDLTPYWKPSVSNVGALGCDGLNLYLFFPLVDNDTGAQIFVNALSAHNSYVGYFKYPLDRLCRIRETEPASDFTTFYIEPLPRIAGPNTDSDGSTVLTVFSKNALFDGFNLWYPQNNLYRIPCVKNR